MQTVKVDFLDQMELRELIKQFFEQSGIDVYRVGEPNDVKFKFYRDGEAIIDQP